MQSTAVPASFACCVASSAGKIHAPQIRYAFLPQQNIWECCRQLSWNPEDISAVLLLGGVSFRAKSGKETQAKTSVPQNSSLRNTANILKGKKEVRSAVDIGNVFSGLSREIPNELFEELAATEACTIERIISRGHSTPEGQWYDQERNEWVIVLKGRALLQFADSDQLVRMEEGDYINIPAHKRHRVAWTDPEEDTVWLAFHYT
jgi:cupin 2 domain-containing protein